MTNNEKFQELFGFDLIEKLNRSRYGTMSEICFNVKHVTEFMNCEFKEQVDGNDD